MKNSQLIMGIPLCLFLLTLFFIKCQPVDDTPSHLESPAINHTVLKKEVGEVADDYLKFYKALDVKGLDNLLTEDCITMGIDPSETWNKTTMIQKIKDLKTNPKSVEFVGNLTFELLDRIVQISKNGTKATVTDQSKVSFSKMLIQRTTMLKKIGNNWKINYINTALVAQNYDLPISKK